MPLALLLQSASRDTVGTGTCCVNVVVYRGISSSAYASVQAAAVTIVVAVAVAVAVTIEAVVQQLYMQ